LEINPLSLTALCSNIVVLCLSSDNKYPATVYHIEQLTKACPRLRVYGREGVSDDLRREFGLLQKESTWVEPDEFSINE
jgi:hypothetical protein